MSDPAAVAGAHADPHREDVSRMREARRREEQVMRAREDEKRKRNEAAARAAHEEQRHPPQLNVVAGSGTQGQLATPSASVVHTEPSTFAPVQGRGNKRPCIALSLNLVWNYKRVNEEFFSNRRRHAGGPLYNDGYDDQDGHYIVIPGEEINERYAVQEVLGKGSFGTVVKCLDSKRLETVALKITRSGRSFRSQAKQEIEVLLKLQRIPGLTESYVARLLKVFDWKGHLCLAFDLLSLNLFQLIQATRFNGVSIDLTRKFAYQILQVLFSLKSHDPPIIHCDIKPENVLLRSNNRSGIRVIDFGSACYENRRVYRYIQSRFYRSPEVILGIDYTTAIDRWSFGAMLVEMHTGVPLFDGRTEAQQLQRMVGLLGPIPYEMATRSPKNTRYFRTEPYAEFPEYPDEPNAARIPHTTANEEGKRWWLQLPPTERHVRQLQNVLGVDTGGPGGRRAGQPGHDQPTYQQFFDFVSGLLIFDPDKRMSVDHALAHPFMRAAHQQIQQSQHPSGPSPEPSASAGPTMAGPGVHPPAEQAPQATAVDPDAGDAA